MRHNTYRWGSQSLTGAASMKHRVPVLCAEFRTDDKVSTSSLTIMGSNPAKPTLVAG